MASKTTKSKELGTLAKLYLKGYNFAQVLGWSYLLYQVISYQLVAGIEGPNLWETVKLTVIIFQSGAVLEIVNALTGLVSSNPIITIFQVLSRVIIVYGIILATPPSYAASSFGLVLCLLAWSVTEIIRYSYYFFNLLGFVPSILTWARYTFFIVLYPIGIMGELLCSYAAHKFASIDRDAWSYTLPNTWNFTFSYDYFLLTYMLLYIPFFPHLYLHMFSQRRKILAGHGSVRPDKATKAH